MVMRVVVGGKHEQDRAGESTVDMVGDNPFEDTPFEDPIELAIVVVEVILIDRIFRIRLGIGRLLNIWFAC